MREYSVEISASNSVYEKGRYILFCGNNPHKQWTMRGTPASTATMSFNHYADTAVSSHEVTQVDIALPDAPHLLSAGHGQC